MQNELFRKKKLQRERTTFVWHFDKHAVIKQSN